MLKCVFAALTETIIAGSGNFVNQVAVKIDS